MLGDLLKVVLEGTQAQQTSPQRQSPNSGASGDLLTELLKGVLSGQAGAASSGTQGQPQDLGGMADIFGDILGGVLGGSAGSNSAMTSNPMTDMVAAMLSEKLGLSPAIAKTVVGFALAALMGKMQQGQGGVSQRSGAAQGFDLDDLLEGDFAWESGLAQQLSAKTGLPEDEAAYNLQEAVMMLTQSPASLKKEATRKQKKPAQPKAAPSKSGLDGLLDTWVVE
ncbi:MAG: hypothetical protein AAF633_26640 [Chloroflexota bacterium]